MDATYRADLRDLNELTFARFDQLRSDMRAQLADQRAELLKWMFLFWAGTVVPLAGLILALHRS